MAKNLVKVTGSWVKIFFVFGGGQKSCFFDPFGAILLQLAKKGCFFVFNRGQKSCFFDPLGAILKQLAKKVCQKN